MENKGWQDLEQKMNHMTKQHEYDFLSRKEYAKAILKDKRLFLLDMDGTLYVDDEVFSGTREFLAEVREGGGRYVFLTNNSSKGVDSYVEKLSDLKIPAKKEDFITSVDATIHIFKSKYGASLSKLLIYVMGTGSFKRQLREAGFNLCDEGTYRERKANDERIDCVLIGFDRELTYKKLEDVCQILSCSEADYFATNPDWVCPTAFGSVPDCGSMAWMIEKATGRHPRFIGKPQPDMAELALARYGFSKKESILIGDRLYTDIACGSNAGIDTVFVLSGEGTLSDLAQHQTHIRPTLVLNGIHDVLSVMRSD